MLTDVAAAVEQQLAPARRHVERLNVYVYVYVCVRRVSLDVQYIGSGIAAGGQAF